MAQGELFPKEPGWEYGSVLPLAQRPIPYAGALAPELALPDIVRSPVNELTKALTLPQRTMLGQATPDAASAAEFAMALTGSAGLMTRAQPNSLGAMMGWHGTPHRFEPVEHNPFGEFKSEAIGSGEGAQTYGHGHYIAGKREVAETYKEKLAQGQDVVLGDKALASKDIAALPDSPERTALQMFAQYGNADAAISHLEQTHKAKWGVGAKRSADDAAAKWLEENREKLSMQPSGSLYQVHMKPDEHELLDWDKPFSEQSPAIKEALKKTGLIFEQSQHLSGKDIYGVFANTMPGLRGSREAAASAALHEAGIPGIKYLDQGSRGRKPYTLNLDVPGPFKSQDFATKKELDRAVKNFRVIYPNVKQEIIENELTSNYVIFHPKNLKITARNGEELPVELVEHDPFQLPVSSEAQQLLRGMDYNEELENMQLGLGDFSPGPVTKKRPGANQ